jgi:hypothetical protein
MWTCSKCGEGLEDTFDVCWSCGTSREGVVDPHFFDTEAPPAPENEPIEPGPALDHDSSEPMVTIAQCSLAAQAHAMRVHLEAAGIPVFLADELTVAMDWLLSNAIGGVKVQVPERYAERAQAILAGFARPSDSERDDADD